MALNFVIGNSTVPSHPFHLQIFSSKIMSPVFMDCLSYDEMARLHRAMGDAMVARLKELSAAKNKDFGGSYEPH